MKKALLVIVVVTAIVVSSCGVQRSNGLNCPKFSKVVKAPQWR